MSVESREKVKHHLKWKGIEIGALHNPLPVNEGVEVKYVDNRTEQELREHYPELNDLNLVHVDYVCTAEDLYAVPTASQDFVIANHLIEHLANPIKGIMEMYRVLKAGGILYVALPDMNRTRDVGRDLTPVSHMILDYTDPNPMRDFDHFVEFAWINPGVNRYNSKVLNREQKQQVGKILWDEQYSIHYHTFTEDTAKKLFKWMNMFKLLDFNLIDRKATSWLDMGDNEFILIYEKYDLKS